MTVSYDGSSIGYIKNWNSDSTWAASVDNGASWYDGASASSYISNVAVSGMDDDSAW